MKLHDCAENEVCVNGDGFYYCEDPNNPEGEDTDVALQKCPEGYTFNGEKMVCDGNAITTILNFTKFVVFNSSRH